MASGNQKVTDPVAPVQEASVTVTDKTGVNYEFQLMQVSSRSELKILRCWHESHICQQRGLRQLLGKAVAFASFVIFPLAAFGEILWLAFKANFPPSRTVSQSDFPSKASLQRLSSPTAWLRNTPNVCSLQSMNERATLCTKRVKTDSFDVELSMTSFQSINHDVGRRENRNSIKMINFHTVHS